MQSTVVGDLKAEFNDAEIPDWRLRQRLLTVATALDAAPEATLPKAMKTTAAREAAYRFLGNRKVSLAAILGPHVRATVERCRQQAEPVLVVSDTTDCCFGGKARGEKLGRLSSKSRGFLAHVAIAVSSSGHPLGVLGIDTVVRTKKKAKVSVYEKKRDPDRESLRWAAMVEQTSALFDGTNTIHVMDSEADIYELLTELQQKKRRYIIRSGQDRLVEGGHLEDVLERSSFKLQREVNLSRRSKLKGAPTSRRNPPREGRPANLSVSAISVTIRRPKTCTAEYPKTLSLNVVRVLETDPPAGEKPVEWILFTSEPADTADQAAAVVDGYRRRWLIEEYFKVIKTGCSYEKRELESMRTLTNLLAIIAVLAWRLLRLRTIDRVDAQRPATDVIDHRLLDALKARLKNIGERKPLPSAPTVSDLMTGIARLGGHITSNGRPGWQVLWRGYQDLLVWGDGYLSRTISITYSDQS